MKITFVLPVAGLAGGIRVVAIHAAKLRARGHAVTIVSQPPRRPGRRVRLARALRGRFRSDPPEPSYFDGLDISHHVLERPRPVTDADLPDADVVIATWWETAHWVAALSPAKGRKFYFVQHHEVHGHLPFHYARASYYLPLRKIVIARWLADVMARDYGDTAVDLVPNSVDLDQFHAPPRARQARPTVGLLYAGTPFKGVDISLAAIEAVRRDIPDLCVVAFGTGPLLERLPLPPGARYFRRPDQDRLREIYAMCDVWLCGSRVEGFGLTILEAMACRCPAVSTRAGGPEEIIEEGVTGHLVPGEDSAALADRLARVLRLPDAGWRAMSDAAHARARSYSWDDAADLFEAALTRG